MGLLNRIQAVFQRPAPKPDPECNECLGSGADVSGFMCTCVSTRPRT